MAGGWKLKLEFCFMETTHEPLDLRKWSVIQWKIMDIPARWILIVILFHWALKYADGAKFWGYVRKKDELICV
jgi:hypothetical protein